MTNIAPTKQPDVLPFGRKSFDGQDYCLEIYSGDAC